MLRLSALNHSLIQSAVIACIGASLAMPGVARTRPHYGGNLRMESEGDPLQRDGASRPIGAAWPLVLDGLTRLDTQGEVHPSLAVRWASENNDHRWQFWLRTGVSFQDNRPLTALSVAASLTESCRIAACPWNGVHVVGHSVVVTSDMPVPDLPAMLAEDAFLIQQTTEVDGQSTPQIIGTGPFRIKAAGNGSVKLEANDDCWQGRPFADAIEFVAHRAASEQWAELDPSRGAGNVDLVELHPAELRQAALRHLNVVTSPADTLLVLEVKDTALSPQLRTSIALAVDRAALYQVIFQKQGEVTASLLPASVSGYSFLFPTDRDLGRAQALRGGVTPPTLTLAAEGTGTIQLAAERLALNLRDAGFAIKVLPPAPGGRIPPGVDLVLRPLHATPGRPAAALGAMLRTLGQSPSLPGPDPATIYKAEHDFLEQHTIIPLLFLPRAWAVGARVRDLHLTAHGMPDLANASIEGAP